MSSARFADAPRQRSPVRRVVRAVAIAVGSLLLVAAIAIAAMWRRDIPLATLLPEYGAPPSKTDGLGMGLSICRSIIHAHGGRLWVSPGVPHGTLFRFTVPIGVVT